jgi:phosphatidylserine decarboxylase
MFVLLNEILTQAPEYNDTVLVGFPINTILDWPMATQAGFTAFLNEKVNQQFKMMLDEWHKFLTSPKSTYVLSTDPRIGWFSEKAIAFINTVAGGEFRDIFICSPNELSWGFKSWDDYFVRRFKPGVRPVAAPNDDYIIVNACESAPYHIQHNIQASDCFWLKGQRYSLRHMMAEDEYYPDFVGGTVYQAYLSACSYHRWHSPVSGTIKKAYTIPGAYYSEAWAITSSQIYMEEQENPQGPNVAALNESQVYITSVAARALILIEADNPAIGLMCFLGVGMAEVSSCQITVGVGQHVQKGEQIGMFHFGGSTHCLLFRKDANIQFDTHGQEPGLEAQNVHVNDYIAFVKD